MLIDEYLDLYLDYRAAEARMKEVRSRLLKEMLAEGDEERSNDKGKVTVVRPEKIEFNLDVIRTMASPEVQSRVIVETIDKKELEKCVKEDRISPELLDAATRIEKRSPYLRVS